MNTLHTQHRAGFGRLTRAILVMAALLFWAGPAVGQGKPEPRDEIEIRVFLMDTVCSYEIVNYPNEDTLLIRPRGRLKVRTEGVAAKIRPGDDEIRPNGPPATTPVKANVGKNKRTEFQVRDAVGAKSSHKLHINCCKALILGVCWSPIDLPGTTEEDDEMPILPGGPRMIIED